MAEFYRRYDKNILVFFWDKVYNLVFVSHHHLLNNSAVSK